jgi:hypothetical protein
MARPIVLEEDDRARKRDLACIATGLWMGAGVGLLVGPFVWPIGLLFLTAGTLVGGIVGRIAAPHISVEEWDPPPNRRPYVGTNSPDDDIAKE